MKPRRKTTGSIVLEKKPRGWMVQVAETDDGLLLHWPVGGSILKRLNVFWHRLFLPLFLCVWIVAGVFVAYRILRGDVPSGLFIWLVFWLWSLVWFAFVVVAIYKPSRPEGILLADDWFCYDPGATCPPMSGWDYSFSIHWRYVFHAPNRMVISRQDLARFELVRTGDCQRLGFQHDLETVEIGNCLIEAERKWLFTVLEHWRAGVDLLELYGAVVENDRIATVDASAIRADSTDVRR